MTTLTAEVVLTVISLIAAAIGVYVRLRLRALEVTVMDNKEKIADIAHAVRDHHEHGPHINDAMANLQRENMLVQVKAISDTNNAQHEAIIGRLAHLEAVMQEMKADLRKMMLEK